MDLRPRQIPWPVLVLPLLCGVAAPGCAGTSRTPNAPAIFHLVLFELEDAGDASALIADSRAMKLEIREIISLSAGTKLEEGRTAAEDAFDVAVSMEFDTNEAYQAYLDHPAHRIIVDRWRPHVRSMRVIDVERGR